MKTFLRCLRRPLRVLILLLAASGPAAAYEVVIGIIVPQTGAMSPVGRSMANGMTLALEQGEDSRSFSPDVELSIKYLDENNRSTPLVQRIIRFAADEEVNLLLGPVGAEAAQAVAQRANQESIPLLSPSNSERITRTGHWAFRSGPSPIELIDQYAQELRKRFPGRPVTVVFPADNAGYRSQAQRFVGTLKADAMPVATTPEGFAAVATRIADQKSPLVIACMDAEPAAALAVLVAKSHPAGTAPQWAFCPAAAQPALLRLGGAAIDNAWIAADYLPQIAGKQNQDFLAAYRVRFGADPDRWAGLGYATGLIAVEAIRAAGPAPSRKMLRLALERAKGIAVPVGGGIWSQDDNRNPHYAAAYFQVRDGQFVAVP